jgi:hypothetical protein
MTKPDRSDAWNGRAETGDRAEAVAAFYISEIRDEPIVEQHTPGDGPHGPDIISTDGLYESKGSAEGHDHASNTTMNTNERQGSAAWIDKVTEGHELYINAEAVGTDDDQMSAHLIDVDFNGGTLATYDLDVDGRRTSNIPNEILPVDDLELAMNEQGPVEPDLHPDLASVELDGLDAQATDALESDLAEVDVDAIDVDSTDHNAAADPSAANCR